MWSTIFTVKGKPERMTTLTDAEVEAFRNVCQLMYDRWITRRVVFEHADVEGYAYHKCADVLRLLNDITIEHTLLQMAKLHDPAEQLGRKNLTLDYIVTYGGWDTQTRSVLADLRGRLDALLAKSLKPARNRVLCHNDLETLINEPPLGDFGPDVDCEYFEVLQEFLSTVYENSSKGRYEFGDIAKRDAEIFLSYIEEEPLYTMRRKNARSEPPP
jgi:hypothetical protein